MRFLTLFIVLFTIPLFSQQMPADSVTGPWLHNMVAGLTATQVSFTDWAQGGENALSWTLTAEGKSLLDLAKYYWSNNYKFAFGQTRLGNQDIRKTDDKIDFESILTYKLGQYVNPYVAATAKTQFSSGYAYDNAGGKTEISAFLDPGYFTQSAGVGYEPVVGVKTRLGAGLREIITSDFNGYADDPATLTEIEKTRIDGGLESVTDLNFAIDDNVLFTSKLELFAPLKTLDEVVVRSDNSIAAKVGKFITANLNVQFINERRITPKTQVKESVAMGLSYTLF